MNIWRIPRFHWPAIVVALLATAYVITPGIVGRLAAGNAYDGVYNSNNGDWFFYAARINNLSRGGIGGNPYLAEHAGDANLIFPGIEASLALIVRATGISTINLLIALNVIAPFVTTILLYAILFKLSKSRWMSAAIPLFLILTNVWNLNKAVHPQINLPILLALIYVWLSLLSRFESHNDAVPLRHALLREWRPVVISGTLLGLLYFSYVYDWSFFIAAMGCSALYALVVRKPRIAVLNTLIVVASAPFGLAYLLMMRKVFGLPFYEDLALRQGIYHSHLPEVIPRTLIAITACFIIFLLIRYAKIATNAVAVGILGLLIANAAYPNMNVVTGTVFHMAGHWSVMPIILYAFGTAFVFQHVKFPPNAPRAVRAFGLTFIALFAFSTLRLSSYLLPPVTAADTSAFVSVQRFGPLLRFLNESTPADSVVLADDQLSYMIPAFTHNYIYHTRYVLCYPATNREIAERYLLANQFDPAFPKDATLNIRNGHQILWESPFRIEETPLYRLVHRTPKPASDMYVDRERQFVKETMDELNASNRYSVQGLRAYRIDYVVWDKERHPDWTMDGHVELEKVFEQNNLILYRLRSV